MRKRAALSGKHSMFQGEQEVLKRLSLGKELLEFGNGFRINGVFYPRVVIGRLQARGYLDEKFFLTESGKAALAGGMKIVKPLPKKTP